MTDSLPEPRLKAPAGTCDTHIHVYGAQDDYPIAPTSPFPPVFAPAAHYEEVMRRLGVDRVVVVQPSAYAKDNRCTIDAVAALGSDRARAVVVVGTGTSDAEMRDLTDRGAVGVRFHMLPGGVLPWEIIEEMAAKVSGFGWHVQLQLDGRLLPEKEAVIRRLPGRLVIDHTGKFLEPVQPKDPAFKTLLGLVERGNTWVKLSAPYETSKAGPPSYVDVGALARELIAAAPERMMWASNWPHPSAQPNPPDDAMLLDILLDWCPDEATRHRILVDNPAELYGFA
ncbi:amidohydrolase family protein [Microbaculum marinum]|uniref:Amidohydrolase family protein n=1 Tax=Microbaculum marinum TaxID=1764581 RepID=A0AAW9RG72_9HYPH